MMMKWIALSQSLLKKGRDNMTKTSIDNLANEITSALKEFTTEVEVGMEKAKEDNAKLGAKTLKVTSPKKTGDYAKGWRAKRFGTAWAVHNATDYQLTHLLEKGYAKVGGGRVSGKPHIGPVEEQVIVGYEKQLEKIIRGR